MNSEFIKEFENCSLNPSSFNHEHHLFMTWFYLTNFDFNTAQTKIVSGLTKLTKHLNVYETKYNETITQVYILLVYKALKANQKLSWADFKNENAYLFSPTKDLLKQHFSIDLFNSVEARTTFIQPDIKAI